MYRIPILLAGLFFFSVLNAQTGEMSILPEENTIQDTIEVTSKPLSLNSASKYLNDLLLSESLWKSEDDSLKLSLQRLLHHLSEPFDSVANRLSAYNFDSISFKDTAFVSYDSIPLYWFNDSTFIIDTVMLPRRPYITKETIITYADSFDIETANDTLPPFDSISATVDSLATDTLTTDTLSDDLLAADIAFVSREPDTIFQVFIDTLFLDSMNLDLYSYKNEEIVPTPDYDNTRGSLWMDNDSGSFIISDTTRYTIGESGTPFFIVPNTDFPDSIRMAANLLLEHISERDSIPLDITDINGKMTRIWLGTGHENLYRYWLKNNKNDSITVWVGNPARNNISVVLEDEVNIKRMGKLYIDEIPITLAAPKTSLMKIEEMKKIPQFWEYDVSTNLSFNQTYLSDYWIEAKGGDRAISTLLDIKGVANYVNAESKTSWNNTGRIKFGAISTRKSTDIIEINSKYNRLLKGKFDFSASLYMKTQVAKGFKYPNDSTTLTVSKFLNPATFTIGLGTEYKPFKHTTLNISPVSYKNTFVIDTVAIHDHTIHGIAQDKKAKQEMGGQLVMENKLKVWKDLQINNNLRLFANYFAQPFNVDVDWEINLKKQVTWFFAVSANLHLLYDADILFDIKDDDGNVIAKEPRAQFKEFVGLSFSFNF